MLFLGAVDEKFDIYIYMLGAGGEERYIDRPRDIFFSLAETSSPPSSCGELLVI